MSTKKRPVEMLDHLTNALVEEILSTSDDDILKEVADDNGNAKAEADKVRAVYEKARTSMSKKRLIMAKEAVLKEKTLANGPSSINHHNARRILEGILLEHPEAAKEFTLAARKEQELSDSDIVGMLEDLQELGLYHPEDDPDGDR